ncbi:bucky ball-like [Gasterosteus aculeatus]
MDDGSKQAHTFGSGQPRTQHPRPFFYVQPPSQPYYLYQHWQMNNPYGPYGVPAGLNFGRPCMNPYQYMQYPGYVFPHAPIYPMDYRRMFEPRFHAPSWNDMPRHQQQPQYPQQYHHHHQQQQQQHPQQQQQQQQQQQPQSPGFRETASSEAQTDPSDAITKLIECLDKIRATELQGAERELDSGVASQSSGMFSPAEEKKKKVQELGRVLPGAPDDEDGRRLPPESPAETFGNSAAAVYDGESSRRSLGGLSPRGCWSAVLEEELPLDSSSIHEEEQADGHFLPLEKAEVADIRSDVAAAAASVPRLDAEELLRQKADPIVPSSSSSSSSSCSSSSSSSSSFTSNQQSHKDAKSGVKVSATDPSYRILKLPFQSVLTPVEAAAGRLSSPTAPYYYNYLSMQTTHERMSVLSPSLDELSSRDEMFSTDLDDADLFPKRIYAGRRLPEVGVGSPKAGDAAGEAWPPGSKRSMCACCGKSLTKGSARSKGHGSKAYRDEAQRDSEEEDDDEEEQEEEEGRYGRGVVRKHSAHRKPHAASRRHAPKPWYKRGQELSAPATREDALEGHDQQQQPPPPPGEAGAATGRGPQCRPCTDRLCREDVTTSDRGGWGDEDVAPRRRPAILPQRQEASAQRKTACHRPRDGDKPLHWDRGSTTREPRC